MIYIYIDMVRIELGTILNILPCLDTKNTTALFITSQSNGRINRNLNTTVYERWWDWEMDECPQSYHGIQSYANILATTKLDQELVRFQSGCVSGRISTGTIATRQTRVGERNGFALPRFDSLGVHQAYNKPGYFYVIYCCGYSLTGQGTCLLNKFVWVQVPLLALILF